MPSWHPDIALADLRIRQRRLAEAEALLIGKDQAMQAMLPTARLHLARGDHRLAAAVARRGLRVLGDDRLRAIELLTVLVDAELAAGSVDAATSAVRRAHGPHRRARGPDAAGTRSCRAPPACRRRRVRSTTPSPRWSATLDGLDGAAVPWLRATLLADLARLQSRLATTAAARDHGPHRGRVARRARRRARAGRHGAAARLVGDGDGPVAERRPRSSAAAGSGGRRPTPMSASACPTRRGCATSASCSPSPASRSTRSTWSTWSRGSTRTAASTAEPWATPARSWTPRPAPPTGAASSSCAPTSRTPSPPISSRPPRRGRTSSTSSSRQLAAAFGLGGRARHAGRPPSGPAST